MRHTEEADLQGKTCVYDPAGGNNPAGSRQLLDLNLHSAVFRPSFCGLVVRNRLAFTETLSRYAPCVNALLHHVVLDRVDSPLRQRLVVGVAANAVGVTR